MERLNLEQIKQVENFLIDYYQIKFDDIRDEVLDHIASEIEDKMTNGIAYEAAFKQTFNKWNKELTPHLWIRYNHVPRFIAKKWYKRDVLCFLLAISIGLCGHYLLSEYITDYGIAQITFKSIGIFNIIISILLYFKCKNIQNYRMQFIKKEAINYGLIPLFILGLFWTSDTNYKMIPMVLIFAIYQSYLFLEACKIKEYQKV
ncbi:hypothetical protein [Myroides injenensis]|uniref:hypothetical protein n=1 Tax=Myroides injenensis TaxID=1183151 RepID=UPI0002882D22|nr:hypothetical protein [Myroides injenensis]